MIMRKLVLMTCFFLFGLGQSALSAPETVTAKINLGEPPEAVAKAAEKFANDLNKNQSKIIQLDLSITSHAGDSTPDYEATTHSGRHPVRCEQGHGYRFGDDAEIFRVQFSSYNHLLLEILYRTGIPYPYNLASCEYDAAEPDAPVFRIRGYYVPTIVTVPQAFDVVLIPNRP